MRVKNILKDVYWIAKIAIIIIFLALIRCIIEPFRLQYLSSSALSFMDIKPFLLGALIAAIMLFIMTILFYYGKYKLVIAACIITIVVLLVIKWLYLSV